MMLFSAFLIIIASLFFKSVKISFSAIAGVLTAYFSYMTICFIVRHYLYGHIRSRFYIFLAMVLKFLILVIICWYATNSLNVCIPAFIAGLSTIVLAVVFYGLLDFIKFDFE